MNTTTRVRGWMFELALPFWSSAGIDRVHGGYVEMFDAQGNASATFKRTRVIARQIYVFSHAALLGWDDGVALATHGFEFLKRHCSLGSGRWARRVSPSGELLDDTQDLYDYAFVLFALAWLSKASGATEPLKLAHATLDVLDDGFRLPNGGFAHELPLAGSRLQNPHMHLLEASLALQEASPSDARFRVLADDIVGLFESRFFDAGTGTLAEHFDDQWGRAPGEHGRWIEPGHQFEWAWILRNHQRLTTRQNTHLVQRLVGFAEAHGVDPATQVTFNAVRDDGLVLDRGSRVWPNTERLKGAIALSELTGMDPWKTIDGSVALLFDHYLDARGTWIDAIDAKGRPLSHNVPTSTLYHLFLAFAEVLRFESGARVQA